MKKMMMIFFVLGLSIALFTVCTASEQSATTGEVAKKEALKTAASSGQVKEMAAETVSAGEGLFKRHCAVCHRDGGNIINKKKTLHKDVLESNGIKTAEDIIHVMRNPGPGMNTFEKTALPVG